MTAAEEPTFEDIMRVLDDLLRRAKIVQKVAGKAIVRAEPERELQFRIILVVLAGFIAAIEKAFGYLPRVRRGRVPPVWPGEPGC